jgi:hypothetical protein
MKKVNKAERWAWIEDWLKRPDGFSAGCLHQQFHEEYHKRFPEYRRKECFWGAQPVTQAMRDLREMEKSGMLESGRVSLGTNWQRGFPKSEIVYTLRKV